MKYYKDNAGEVFVYDEEDILKAENASEETSDIFYNIKKKIDSMTEMTPSEIEEHINPQPTEEEIAATALSDWKYDRQNLVDNTEVSYNGVIYQGDETSQDRMSRAINGLPDDTTTIIWVAKDNSVQNLTRVDLKAILFAAVTQQATFWNDGRPETRTKS